MLMDRSNPRPTRVWSMTLVGAVGAAGDARLADDDGGCLPAGREFSGNGQAPARRVSGSQGSGSSTAIRSVVTSRPKADRRSRCNSVPVLDSGASRTVVLTGSPAHRLGVPCGSRASGLRPHRLDGGMGRTGLARYRPRKHHEAWVRSRRVSRVRATAASPASRAVSRAGLRRHGRRGLHGHGSRVSRAVGRAA
jgi:hypothetical protein